MKVLAKRSVLTAFLLSVMAPCSGLLYMHKPVRALICLFFVLAAVAAAVGADLLASWEGLLGCLAVGGAAWLYALLNSLLLARKGLTPDEAQHDMGPWIVAYLAVSFVVVWLAQRPEYTGYRVAGETMAPTLMPGDYVLTRRAGSLHDAPVPGDLVIVLAESGESSGGSVYIRRLAAVGGDVLEIHDGVLRRNGTDTDIRLDALPDGTHSGMVPDHAVLLTADSGEGPLHNQWTPQGAIRARLLYIYWSADLARLGDIKDIASLLSSQNPYPSGE